MDFQEVEFLDFLVQAFQASQAIRAFLDLVASLGFLVSPANPVFLVAVFLAFPVVRDLAGSRGLVAPAAFQASLDLAVRVFQVFLADLVSLDQE